MQMTHEEAKRRFPNAPPPVPAEFAGQWVAWNKDRTEAVAHGASFGKVRAEALAAGCREPVMQRVTGAPFVGRA